jgi:rare lipoprotein A
LNFAGQGARLRAIIGKCAVLTALAALAACGTTRPAAVSPPPPTARVTPPPVPAAPGAPVPNPAYKVGNPYQVAGVWYYPREQPDYDETGIASWYGSAFHGQVTADGEVFDRNAITAASPTLPMPVNVRVTNLQNGRSIVVRVNDRGPFVNGRIIDLSERAADLLGYKTQGTARVRVTYLGRADLHGWGYASGGEETPMEIATALPAVPAGKIAAASLAPVSGVPVAPPTREQALPRPVTPVESAALPPVPDGSVTRIQVPAATAIYVQAGAFSSPTNAGSVAAKLYMLGARVMTGTKDGKPIYRVRIGPFQDVDSADAVLARVQALGHNDVQIVVDSMRS